MSVIVRNRPSLLRALVSVRMCSGESGSGAGKGGVVREAEGSKMEVAKEDEYFYNKQKEQITNLRAHLHKEIAFHQEQIKRHEDAILRHTELMSTTDKI